MINEIFLSIALILFIIGTVLLVRYLTMLLRLLGGISDEDAENHNLPFSKHFKIKLDAVGGN